MLSDKAVEIFPPPRHCKEGQPGPPWQGSTTAEQVFPNPVKEATSAEDAHPPGVNLQEFAAKMKTLGVDVKAEETRLREVTGDLMSFAKGAGMAVPSLRLPNTILPISSTEWQTLVCEYSEKSFRADLNRVLRRAVGVLACLQEEMALYRVRSTTEHLCKKHVNSLAYLGYSASLIFPELQRLDEEARQRGLVQKAEHVEGVVARLQQFLGEISKTVSLNFAGETGKLNIDPQWQEEQVAEMIGHLVSVARASEEAISEIPLSQAVLVLSDVELEALRSEFPETEKSFRADLNRVTRRAVGLKAVIQEETALYRLRSTSKDQWQKHLYILLYCGHGASQILPQLEELTAGAGRRGLPAKAEQLKELWAWLDQEVNKISELRQQWKGPAVTRNAEAMATA